MVSRSYDARRNDAGDPEAAVRTGLAELAQTYATHGHVLAALADAASYDDSVRDRYRQLATALTATYVVQTFGRAPFATDPATAAATLAEIWVRTIYARG